MADITPDTIVCRFDSRAEQWVAHFEHRPQVAFGTELPMDSVRRLLKGTAAPVDTFPLMCDADRAGSSVLQRTLIWQPPEILFPCSACNATGKYVGFLEVEQCKVCGGRKLVSDRSVD